MEITHSTLEGNVLQEFTKDYLEKHKELIEFVKKETIKQLSLYGVSQRSELLKGYNEYLEDYIDTHYLNDDIVDNYLDTL